MSNTVVMGFRLPKKDKELLEKVCTARREDISDFIRRAVAKELATLSFLTEEEKKALGVNNRR
jgi:hypothetical protein